MGFVRGFITLPERTCFLVNITQRSTRTVFSNRLHSTNYTLSQDNPSATVQSLNVWIAVAQPFSSTGTGWIEIQI